MGKNKQSKKKNLKSNKGSIFTTLIVGLSLLILMFLYLYFTNFRLGPAQKVTVGLKWLNQAQFSGMFVAQEQGQYSKHGLKVSFKNFDFDSNHVEDLLGGETDFALVSAEELILLLDDNAPVQAVASIYQTSPYVIVSLTDAQIITPADFAGKVLGSKGGKKEEELFYLLLLNSVGLSVEDVDIRELGFAQREIDDLVHGDAHVVDLYRTDQLYFFDKENLDYNLILPEQYGVNTYNDVLITRLDVIENNPEMVKSFVQATINGWELAIEDVDGALSDTMKYVDSEIYQDIEYERYILENSIPLIRPDLSTQIGSMNYSKWDHLKEQMIQKGFIKNSIDTNDIFTTEFLR